MNYETFNTTNVPIKSWTKNVPFDDCAKQQLRNIAELPFIFKWVAAMPDVHLGKGATIGSVIPTVSAIIPAAVGVDIGCGMIAVRTSLSANHLPDNLHPLRSKIESYIPHGRSNNARRGKDIGAWRDLPKDVIKAWQPLDVKFKRLTDKHTILANTNNIYHLGTLGTGNHFIEICLDESQNVWLMLHSGSRGVGNRIGTYFIELAKEEMLRKDIHLPDKDLAYLTEGSQHFKDYVEAVEWAQNYAEINRKVMMERAICALRDCLGIPFNASLEAVNCHHNYVAREYHYDREVYITRKGAVSAKQGELGIIPGSMGAQSYIVRGLGNQESFCSCSHGAGRIMSRNQAKKLISIEQHVKDTNGVECRKDKSVIDETPKAYKDITQVMAAQSDLVEIIHTLKQVVCVKG